MISSSRFNGTALVLSLGIAALLAGCQSQVGPKVANKEDPCGAVAQKHLLGGSAKDLNMSTFPAGTRLLYPTSPMTRDYRADRLNIHADKNGKIIRLECN